MWQSSPTDTSSRQPKSRVISNTRLLGKRCHDETMAASDSYSQDVLTERVLSRFATRIAPTPQHQPLLQRWIALAETKLNSRGRRHLWPDFCWVFVFFLMLASREILKEQHYSRGIKELAVLGWLSTGCCPQHKLTFVSAQATGTKQVNLELN